MKKFICVLFAVLYVAAFALSGCGNSNTTATDAPETEAVTTEAAADNVDENSAKTIALEDAGVPETAAENLVVNTSKFEGAKAYVVTFEWSGFEYQYTIKASTGEILETLFDGDVI